MGGTTVSVVIYLTATFAAGTPFRSTATSAIPGKSLTEVSMTRRKIILGAAIGSAVLGVAALVGIAGHYAILRDDDDDDDDGRDAVARGSRFAKVNLQQGLTTGEQEGQPISGKFEID